MSITVGFWGIQCSNMFKRRLYFGHGETLRRFSTRQVGAGSYGAVWKAHCRGQAVAVKCPGQIARNDMGTMEVAWCFGQSAYYYKNYYY